MRLNKLSTVILLSGCVATTACGCRIGRDAVLKMGLKVETQLPLGSTKEQATKFLDDRHIEHAGRVQLMDTHRYDTLEQIDGNVPGYSGDEPGKVVFFFRDDKLVEWWVYSGCGGCYSKRANNSEYRPKGIHQCYDP